MCRRTSIKRPTVQDVSTVWQDMYMQTPPVKVNGSFYGDLVMKICNIVITSNQRNKVPAE